MDIYYETHNNIISRKSLSSSRHLPAPITRRGIKADWERTKQNNDKLQPMFGINSPIVRLKSRKSFLKCTQILDRNQDQERIDRWKSYLYTKVAWHEEKKYNIYNTNNMIYLIIVWYVTIYFLINPNNQSIFLELLSAYSNTKVSVNSLVFLLSQKNFFYTFCEIYKY